MAKAHISESLKTFIREKIQTVLRLEVLLLLEHHPSRSFTAAEVANELSFDKDAAKAQLAALEEIGVIAHSNSDKPSRYRYHPENATLRSMVEQLSEGYSKQRVPVLSMILADNSDRTRLFAEAFRIIRKND